MRTVSDERIEDANRRKAEAIATEKQRVAESALMLGSCVVVISACVAYWLWK